MFLDFACKCILKIEPTEQLEQNFFETPQKDDNQIPDGQSWHFSMYKACGFQHLCRAQNFICGVLMGLFRLDWWLPHLNMNKYPQFRPKSPSFFTVIYFYNLKEIKCTKEYSSSCLKCSNILAYIRWLPLVILSRVFKEGQFFLPNLIHSVSQLWTSLWNVAVS